MVISRSPDVLFLNHDAGALRSADYKSHVALLSPDRCLDRQGYLMHDAGQSLTLVAYCLGLCLVGFVHFAHRITSNFLTIMRKFSTIFLQTKHRFMLLANDD